MFKLLCPTCGESYLHQEKVDVFWRGEDAKQGTHVMTDGVQVTIDEDTRANPSTRRQGMSISFSCETCVAGGVKDMKALHISQHKGETHISWDDEDADVVLEEV